jgi:hypothetical protein
MILTFKIFSSITTFYFGRDAQVHFAKKTFSIIEHYFIKIKIRKSEHVAANRNNL